MSRIFMLSVNVSTEPYPVYPLGMAIIASALARRGHEIRQFDFLASGCSQEGLRQALTEFAPDFVCISLRNIDNVDSFSLEKAWYLPLAREQVGLVRGVTTAPIIVGGSGFSLMPEDILEFIGADYGIVGEGEVAVCELVAALADGVPMPRMLSAKQEPLSCDAMMPPLYDKGLLDFYMAHSGMLSLQTKRGCPHICGYCTYPSLEGGRFRPRDPGAVVDDVERAWRDYGVDSFFFTDSIFNDPVGHHLKVAEELARRDLPVKWTGFFRPQGISRDKLALLKRSGLYAVEFGADAACDATLRAMTKGFAFADVLEANEACLAEEIPCAHFVIFGGPDETPATVKEGLENMEKLGGSVVFAFSGIRILAGTQVHRLAIREGVLDAGASLLKPVYYFSPRIDPETMNSTIIKSFRNRSDRIFPPPAGQEKMAVLRRFGFKGILWDKLLSFSPDRKMERINGRA